MNNEMQSPKWFFIMLHLICIFMLHYFLPMRFTFFLWDFEQIHLGNVNYWNTISYIVFINAHKSFISYECIMQSSKYLLYSINYISLIVYFWNQYVKMNDQTIILHKNQKRKKIYDRIEIKPLQSTWLAWNCIILKKKIVTPNVNRWKIIVYIAGSWARFQFVMRW